MKKISLPFACSGTVSIALASMLAQASAETLVDLEATASNGLLSVQSDAPDADPRMLVGHFNYGGAWGIMRGAMTFKLGAIPDGVSVVSASLSVYARSAPWAPANPDGAPTAMEVKDAGAIMEGFEGLPLAWGSFETKGGDVSGPALALINPEDYFGEISAENRFASSVAFVTAVQRAIDDGRDTINLVIHCPELDAADPKPPGKNFYRIDNHQNQPETAPVLHLAYAIDSDADGMEDDWELIFFPGDLARLGRGQDNDSDGLPDEAEFFWKADPTKRDSDADTLADGDEVNIHGSDPSKADTDGDDIDDNHEVEANPYVTNPARADTDGDGIKDKVEIILRGTDPSKADTDDDSYDDGLEARLGSNPADAASTPGLLARGGIWNVLHAEIAEFQSIEELKEIIENEDYIDSVEVQLPIVNFDNLVAGDYSESEMNYPLFDEPTTDVSSLVRVTGTIVVKQSGEVTLGYNTNAGALLRVDGEEVEVFKIGTANSGRATMAATLNLLGGTHEVEFLHWFTGTAGVSLLAAYELGVVDAFFRDDFELMPAFQVDPIPFDISIMARSDGKITVEWSSTVGETYAVDRATDLQGWLELEAGIPAVGETTTYTDELPPADTSFYRVRR